MHMSPTLEFEDALNSNPESLADQLWIRLDTGSWPFDIAQLPEGTVLVGGAVRDALLNRLKAKPDLDFVVPKNAIQVTTNLAREIGGSSFVLDINRDMARLTWEGWTFDFASQIGISIEDDLFRRDFTINSIALTLKNEHIILDPTGGIKDLLGKKLRAVSERNLFEDPLRPLRGMRLMADLELAIESETRTFIKTSARFLRNIAPERIQSELQRIVSVPNADQAISLIQSFEFLDLWKEDSSISLRKMPTFSDAKCLNHNELKFALPLLRLSHLISNDGLNYLRFSKQERRRCKLLKYWLNLYDESGFGTLSEDNRFSLHKDLEDFLPALILYLAPKQKDIWLRRWRDNNDPLFHPRSPLDGNILKNVLSCSPGPALGELMNYLSIERAFGRLQSREEALQIASEWKIHKEHSL